MKKRHILLNNRLRVIYTLSGKYNPNNKIEGVFGQEFVDLSTGQFYICVSIPTGKTWQLLIGRSDKDDTAPTVEYGFATGFFAKGSAFDKTRISVGKGNPNQYFIGERGSEYFNQTSDLWHKCTSQSHWLEVSTKADKGAPPKKVTVVVKEPIIVKGVRKDLKFYTGYGSPNQTFGGLIGELFFDLETEILYKCSTVSIGDLWSQLTEFKNA